MTLKKVYHFAALLLISCSIACNNSSTETTTTSTTTDTKTTATTPALTNQPEGLVLITKSDCGNCHNASTKIVGPAYKDIAAKYPNNADNISKLADEVIKGSTGIWSAVPMAAHPALQKPDVEKMVGYILTVK